MRRRGPVAFRNRSVYPTREIRRLFRFVDWPDDPVVLLVAPRVVLRTPKITRDVGGIVQPFGTFRAILQWGPDVPPAVADPFETWLVAVCLLPEQELRFGVERTYSARMRAACWPRYAFNSWQERFVGVLAHELDHVRHRGELGGRVPTRYWRRQGEIRAERELVAALERFRAA